MGNIGAFVLPSLGHQPQFGALLHRLGFLALQPFGQPRQLDPGRPLPYTRKSLCTSS
jgi:hypothetical protein